MGSDLKPAGSRDGPPTEPAAACALAGNRDRRSDHPARGPRRPTPTHHRTRRRANPNRPRAPVPVPLQRPRPRVPRRRSRPGAGPANRAAAHTRSRHSVARRRNPEPVTSGLGGRLRRSALTGRRLGCERTSSRADRYGGAVVTLEPVFTPGEKHLNARSSSTRGRSETATSSVGRTLCIPHLDGNPTTSSFPVGGWCSITSGEAQQLFLWSARTTRGRPRPADAAGAEFLNQCRVACAGEAA